MLLLYLQAALDNLQQLISLQTHLPPIAGMQHLQTALASQEADGAPAPSVEQVQKI